MYTAHKPTDVPTNQMVRASDSLNAAGLQKGINMTGTIGADYCHSDGDAVHSIIFYMYCSGKETSYDTQYYKHAGGGIFDLYINDVLDTAGMDTYSAGTVLSQTEIVLTIKPRRGLNVIRMTANGKNVASAGYVLITMGVRLR